MAARVVAISSREVTSSLVSSDAHESSILPEALGVASIFLPRNRLALLEPYSITLAYSPHSFSGGPPFATPLDATRLYSRGGRTPRRPSTRPLVCITAGQQYPFDRRIEF
jgi:hypothetical protein